MYKILILLLLSNPYYIDINWKTCFMMKDGTSVRSSTGLSEKKKRKLKKIYSDIRKVFLYEFEPNLDCKHLKPFEIRIINYSTLHSRGIFELAGEHDFGRYFGNINHLYITDELFYHPEYLAHELAHYFYDECDIKINTKEEHRRVYRFQEFYRRKK